jgi:hypothetical protein
LCAVEIGRAAAERVLTPPERDVSERNEGREVLCLLPYKGAPFEVDVGEVVVEVVEDVA